MKARSENATVRFSFPAFSARRAETETAKAASPVPSITATSRTSAKLFVIANPMRLKEAQRFPSTSIFRRPYRSARIPKGMLSATRVTPMTEMGMPAPIPWRFGRKYDRSE
jgi:hypothetical protein